MATAASSVVMQNRGMQWRTGNPEYVLITFPYWVKFIATFPKGHIVEKTPESNTYKINAIRLLDWLYDNGHTPYNSSMLVQQTKEFERLEKSVERMLALDKEDEIV